MSRSSLIATTFRDAWGTAGTQSMKPSPHIEGLGSWAGKMDDRMCFLAFQQADVVFAENVNAGWDMGDEQFDLLETWPLYYNGYHPEMLLCFDFVHSGGAPVSHPGTFSTRLGDVDLGTIRVSTAGATHVGWYINIPAPIEAGEYDFSIYGASDESYFLMRMYRPHLTFVPGGR